MKPEDPVGHLAALAAGLARAACREPKRTALLGLLLALAALQVVVRGFALDTDISRLFRTDLPWRATERAMAEAFPQREDLIAVVVDGATGDVAERATAALEQALSGRQDLFSLVQRPDGSAFFRRSAFLFLPEAEVEQTLQQVIAAQPLLGTLAADPSLRGVASAFGLVLQGVERGEAKLSDVATPLARLTEAAEAAAAGRPAWLDWSALITGRAPSILETRRFLLLKPRLNFDQLSPGAAATDVVRAEVARLQLNAAHGVRVRLTGQVVMSDEEFGSLSEGAAVDTTLSLLLVAMLLWLALRSLRLILPVLATLLLGLLVTAAFGVLVIGPFNPLSIAFAVLFIGLGVDFGIQFAVRYREIRHRVDELPGALGGALAGAAHAAGPGILLAAAAIALGFLAFLPTDYRGVSELGAIAGFGLLVAGLLSLTVLPALVALTAPPGEAEEVGFLALQPLDSWLARHARPVTMGVGVLALLCMATLPWLRFDFDPLNLRDPNSEAVATFRDLMKVPETTPDTLSVLVPSLTAAGPRARQLEAVPGVAMAMTLHSFVPEEQAAKLALIQDAADLLGPTFEPPQVAPPPDHAATMAALSQLAAGLRQAAQRQPNEAASGQRLADALDRLMAAPPEAMARFATAIVPGLQTVLGQLRDALAARPVALADLPPELVRDWVAPDGRARIELYPRDLSGSNEAMRRFAQAVQAVAPDASGTAISIQASSRTIRHAFLIAGVIALVLTVALLLATLRDVRLALLAMAPLALAALLTLATSALLGPALNLANIIALPLLFGIGVAFDIYYVTAWRGGERRLLPSALTRAVLFSALTTASAFGTLALSRHPGTASMGLLLAMSLFYTLAAVLLALPALLHLFGGAAVAAALAPTVIPRAVARLQGAQPAPRAPASTAVRPNRDARRAKKPGRRR